MGNQRQFDKPGRYLVEIRGYLDASWSDWLDGFNVAPLDNNVTALTGSVEDQAALYGLIARIGGLGLLLLSVQRVADEENNGVERNEKI